MKSRERSGGSEAFFSSKEMKSKFEFGRPNSTPGTEAELRRACRWQKCGSEMRESHLLDTDLKRSKGFTGVRRKISVKRSPLPATCSADEGYIGKLKPANGKVRMFIRDLLT